MSQSIAKALIVDDEPDIRELLEITLNRMNIDTDSAGDVQSAKQKLESNEYDLCLTDMKLPDGNGIELVAFIQHYRPQLPVAMITAYGSTEAAVDALKNGAFDFVSKPVELERLRTMVNTALKLEPSIKSDFETDTVKLIGNTEVVEKLRKQIIKLGRSQAPVFINGESGSGKELAARLIHANSPRSNGPFIPVNCGAIPNELMESEFFGHKKGSFTGASDDKIGLFEAANGGTLFLDEVADLPLAMQVKLLRAIQEKAVRRVGDNSEKSVDIRILSATHKNLNDEVEQQRFRSDLFYRINVIELKVPPLRDRRDDIPLLAGISLKKLAEECGLPPATLTDEALTALKAHSFPGNIRELENILERAFTLCEDDQITAADLQLGDSQGAAEPDAGDSVKGQTGIYPAINPEEAFGSMEEYLESIEKEILMTALEREKWNKTAAAKLLGISFRTMRYRLKKFDLE